MRRTILIPTDFTIESLSLFKAAAQSVEIGKINVIFFHCAHLSDSIFDLLFFSSRKQRESLVNEDFEDGCKIIRHKYASRINSVRTEIFSGRTQNAFENFLDANDIDEIVIPKDYKFQLTSNRSFDPMPFILKSKLPTTEVTWERELHVPEKNQLAELFRI